jgi:hypothetical protein
MSEVANQTTESGGNVALRAYEKHRTTTEVGEIVAIPGHAIGITVSDLSPFGDWVQVSWLEPVDGDSHGVVNELEVHATRTNYADESPVELPLYAVAPTVWEPPESTESVIYWLA